MAFEKVIAGAIHAGLAGLIALPAMMLLMHRVTGVDVRPAWAVLLPLIAACGVVSAAFGLTAVAGAPPSSPVQARAVAATSATRFRTSMVPPM